MKLNEFTMTALHAARAGGTKLLSFFSRALDVEYKGAIDPVTIADRTSQAAVTRVIARKWPHHAIMGEEDVIHPECREFCWIVDPLDGTVNFIHRVPNFAVSVAVLHRGRVIAGVVHAPALRETFVAQRHAGAWRNGVRLRVSDEKNMVRSLVATGFPYTVHQKHARVIRNLTRVMTAAQGIRRMGAASLDLAGVAAGHYEAFWEEGLAAWDVAAGALLVTEAGGKVSDFMGKQQYLFTRSIVATNGKLHAPMMRLVRP